jgi:hypothetical protein
MSRFDLASRRPNTLLNGRLKSLSGLDDVIGRHYCHRRVWVNAANEQRGEPDARGGVPLARFSDDRRRWQLGEQLTDGGYQPFARDY